MSRDPQREESHDFSRVEDVNAPSSGLEAVAEADVADGETVTVSDGNTLYIVTTGSDEAWLVASLSGRNVTANTENNR